MSSAPLRQTLLITGASGFVGTALVTHLAQRPEFRVRAAVRRAQPAPAGVEQRVVADIAETTDWSAALRDVHAVVHLAARVHVMKDTSTSPLADFRRVNVAGTMALATQAARAGVRRFVFVSSIKVNGEAGVFNERQPPAPGDPYGVSKHEAELALRELAARTGMEVVIIRPPLVYGPGVKANFRSLMRLVTRGVPLPLGAVHNKRSFVALGNLVDLITLAITHPLAANETFFVSDGHDMSTTELIQSMGRAVGRNARLIPVPASLLQTVATIAGQRASAQRLLGSLQVDITKARDVLGWTPPLSVEEGLRRAAAK